MMPALDLSRFQANGPETCVHGRPIQPQIYAGLDGQNWRLKDVQAPGRPPARRKAPGPCARSGAAVRGHGHPADRGRAHRVEVRRTRGA